MISFVHPGFLYGAAAASALVIALHFLVAEQPRTGVLPTVRFFPDVDVRSTTLAVRLSDVLLLLLRVATLMLIGSAFAQPRVKPSRSAVLRIVAVDASSSVASGREAADSAARYTANAASVIFFDSVAREASGGDVARRLNALRADSVGGKTGSISSALIVALRAASRLREGADSLDLVLVSPLLVEERDSATLAIRALWPGRITIARVAGASPRAAADASLEWADSSAAEMWTATPPDTVGGVFFAGQAIVYPFERKWKLAAGDSAARVTGRWADGEPAIVERTTPAGCVRSVSLALPAKGDAILRPSFARFLRDLSAPCFAADRSPLPPAIVASVSGNGGLAPAARIEPEAARMTPLVPWLLGAALALALLELILRRRDGRGRDEEESRRSNSSGRSRGEEKAA